MAMNNVQLQGRVAFVNYKEGDGDKKSFLTFAISHNTGRKENPEDQYNKENLYRCKAFGNRADFIYRNFPEKSQILIEGTLDIGNDYTNKDGEIVKGGVEILIKEVHFCGQRETGDNNNHAATQQQQAPRPNVAPRPAVTPTPRPTVAPRPSIKPVVPQK